MKKNNKGKKLLEIIQENYDVETAQDLSSALSLLTLFNREQYLIILDKYSYDTIVYSFYRKIY